MALCVKNIVMLFLNIGSVYSDLFSVQLADGSTMYEGRLEIYYNGEWGTVCDDGWDYDDARVVCRELGFGDPVQTLISSGYQGNAYQSILLDDVDCSGSESSLSSCSYSTIGVHNCGHSEDVALECSPESFSTDFSVRLAEGISIYEGRLEIYYEGEWGTVCDDGWDEDDARVVCRELGYGDPVQTLISFGYQGNAYQSILLDDVDCSGSESSLSSCSYSTIGVHDCGHSEDVALECSPESFSTDFSVRLAEGISIYEGRLEIYYGGEWGTVCDDDWDKNDARVVCRQLGFGDPVQILISSGYEGNIYQSILLDDVDCSGSESNLSLCSYTTIGVHNCGHSEDVALECSLIRLVDGVNTNVGRLEIMYDEEWVQVCNSHWTDTNSEVVCRELGYDGVDTFIEDYYIPAGSGPYRYSFQCYGYESSLLDCTHNSLEEYYCYDPVRLQCADDYGSQGDVRLSGSYGDQGILEAYLYGTWGTVCSRNWYKDESDVICRQLGFDGAKERLDDSHLYYTAYKTIHRFTIDCTGEESQLSDCYFSTEDIAYDCTHDDDVALTCVNEGLSGGVIAGIVIGIVVLMILIGLCLCHFSTKKTPLPSNSIDTNHPAVTNVALQVQNNAYQPSPIFPSAPPAWHTEPPPSYDHVINNTTFTHPGETSPPTYTIPYQPPLHQSADQTTHGGGEMYSYSFGGGNVLYSPSPFSK